MIYYQVMVYYSFAYYCHRHLFDHRCGRYSYYWQVGPNHPWDVCHVARSTDGSTQATSGDDHSLALSSNNRSEELLRWCCHPALISRYVGDTPS